MIKSYFQAVFYDQEMSYLRSSPRRRSRSFVQAFLKSLFLTANGNSYSLSITDTAGAGSTYSGGSTIDYYTSLMSTSPGRVGFGAGMVYTGNGGTANSSTNSGIVVGTGTTAVTPTDTALTTIVADGVSASTLEYFPCSATSFTTSATQGSFALERLFRNSSSGSITINEVGVYAMNSKAGGFNGHQQPFHCCIIRDIVSPGFAVANGEYMRIIYTITVTA